jgi:outer membrane lipoprotein carrier protein
MCRRRSLVQVHRRAAFAFGALVWLAAGLAGPATAATGPSLAAVLAAHCRARDETSTLQARFTQTRVFETLDESDRSAGVLYYRKPDTVRWQYLEPDTSWVVLCGNAGWAVFPRIRQVQKVDLKQSRADAVLALVGFGSCGENLQDVFEISMAPAAGAHLVLTLVPKRPELAASFARIELALDSRDYLPRKVVLHETAGDRVDFEFFDLRRGGAIDAALFRYEIPPGYEVVE